MNRLAGDAYRSPSANRAVRWLENRLLAGDQSWWTGRRPLYTRVVAGVPRALYLNFAARKSYAASLSPELFHPLDLPGDDSRTLFTILLFSLEDARPLWMPRAFGAFAPRMMQSNWRFYGDLREGGGEWRSGVLFVRTVTTSWTLSLFGRRLARCFPLRRARRMTLVCGPGQVTAAIDPGGGSAPELKFEGVPAEAAETGDLCGRFDSYDSYARWIIDQHLSLVIWPREYVVQDMHLDFAGATITPLRCLTWRVAELKNFISDERPMDAFLVEGLTVFLDRIYSVTTSGTGKR